MASPQEDLVAMESTHHVETRSARRERCPLSPPETKTDADVDAASDADLPTEPLVVPVTEDEPEVDLDTTASDPVTVQPRMSSLRLQTRGGRMRADQVCLAV